MKINLQNDIIEDLTRRKQISREYLRSLSPLEKIEKLVQLQEQYYQTLQSANKAAVVRFPTNSENGIKRVTKFQTISKFLSDQKTLQENLRAPF